MIDANHLHAQANAQQRLPAADMIRNRFDQTALAQPINSIAKRSDAWQNKNPGIFDAASCFDNLGLSAAVFYCLRYAEKISCTVVDYCGGRAYVISRDD